MTELTEKEQQTLNTGRVMRAESDVILPLLQTKQDLVIARIVAHFREGDRDKVFAAAAELSILREMRSNIASKIKEAEHYERKMLEEEHDDGYPSTR